MTKYAYVATGPDGHQAAGVTKAATREAAELALYERELRDLRVTEKRSVLRLELSAPRIKREDLMHLSRQLGAFIAAGLPLVDAVRMLGEEASNSSLRRIMAEIEDSLRRGETLSDCTARHPRVFPDFYTGILASAEVTGQLDTVLEQLAKYLERDLDAKRTIKSALVYPGVVAGLSVVTVVVLSWFVLPKFKVFFGNLGATLPLPTRMLMAFTDFLLAYWWAVLGGAVALALLCWLPLFTEAGRHARDRLLLAVPVLGDTIRYALVERFCRILASMAGAGVPLPEALRVATESLPNLVFTRALATAGEAMLQGEGLARPLAATGLFPSTAARMIRVGEETGTLDTQLEVTARYYEGELGYKIKKLTSLFEPAVICVMGGVVGFVALALVKAMYGIFEQVHVR
ncbi:MAG: type pilus assembly protein PilC [Frankiaceae bacterium]|jgi:type IV pilus assembly protein PilC|nr:type pilus assembly protein PilC [Frankiaceae bacterium]